MSERTLPPGFREPVNVHDSEEFFVNMGPQHPSTHGALRLALRLDGETIVEVVPHFGYIHRGLEKQAESGTYLQYIPYAFVISFFSFPKKLIKCSHLQE